MKTLTCLTCQNEMIAVVNSQDLGEVKGFWCVTCDTFTSFCVECGEEFTVTRQADMVRECGGNCKYREDFTAREDEFAKVDREIDAWGEVENDTDDLDEDLEEWMELYENSR